MSLSPFFRPQQRNVENIDVALERIKNKICYGNKKHKRVTLSIEGNIGAGKSTLLNVLFKWIGPEILEILTEPVSRWKDCRGQNLLEAYYSDPKRYAYTFQSFAFITRLMEQLKPQHHTVRILERSALSDYCFALNCYQNGLMNKIEWAAYEEWWTFFTEANISHSSDEELPSSAAITEMVDGENDLNTGNSFGGQVDNGCALSPASKEKQKSIRGLPHGLIYLRTKPDTCFSRMKKRNRSEESSVPLDYLQQLHSHHDNWFPKGAKRDSNHGLPFVTIDADADFESDIELQKQFVLKTLMMIDELLLS